MASVSMIAINNLAGVYTHMPFMMSEGRMLYCRSTDENRHPTTRSRRWKVWSLVNGKDRRLETGLPDDTTECSPTCWSTRHMVHVTFIAGGGKKDPLYKLYRMDGPTLESLNLAYPIQCTRTGFVRGSRMVYADPLNIIHIRQTGRDMDLEIPGAIIYRVTYRADQSDILLISGQWHLEGDVFSIEYDIISGEHAILECDGRPAYKCSVYKDKVFYADCTGPGFESRHIREAKTINRIPINSIVRRRVGAVDPINTLPLGCSCTSNEARGLVTRPSCQECVEKHLGAAYVLLAETYDGYAHRLRAIGHLVEAEDESQEWIDLHDAIREARKKFQLHGTMPRWNTLGFLVDKIRQSSIDQTE